MTRLALALLALSLLAGCGIKGGLERPGPIWGADDGAPPSNGEATPADSQRDDDEEDDPDYGAPPLPR